MNDSPRLDELLDPAAALERLAGLDLDSLRALHGRILDLDALTRAAIRQQLKRQKATVKSALQNV